MKKFIKNHQYNIIVKELLKLQVALKSSQDPCVLEANKSMAQDNIYQLFENLALDESFLLNIEHISEADDVKTYLNILSQYVYGITEISNSQIKKVFKKEKHLKFPDETLLEDPKSYYSWVDISSKRIYVVYEYRNEFLGFVGHIQNMEGKQISICKLCNRSGTSEDVIKVSTRCKTSNNEYRSLGFSMCSDVEACNRRITSTENIEKIIKDINKIL